MGCVAVPVAERQTLPRAGIASLPQIRVTKQGLGELWQRLAAEATLVPVSP